jgi:hypothetical protein
MEQYKKSLKMRIAVLSVSIAALITLLILNESGTLRAVGANEFSEFLRGFQTGILFSVCIIFGYLIGRCIWILNNKEKLKAAYYTENDERHKLIMMKIGGNAMYVCTVAILIGGIVAGYFNEIVFFSLAGCALFLLVVRCALKIYYHKKF